MGLKAESQETVFGARSALEKLRDVVGVFRRIYVLTSNGYLKLEHLGELDDDRMSFVRNVVAPEYPAELASALFSFSVVHDSGFVCRKVPQDWSVVVIIDASSPFSKVKAQ